jgi:hypothetical protein
MMVMAVVISDGNVGDGGYCDSNGFMMVLHIVMVLIMVVIDHDNGCD